MEKLCKLASHRRSGDSWTKDRIKNYLKYTWVRLMEQERVQHVFAQQETPASEALQKVGLSFHPYKPSDCHVLVFRTGLFDDKCRPLECICAGNRFEDKRRWKPYHLLHSGVVVNGDAQCGLAQKVQDAAALEGAQFRGTLTEATYHVYRDQRMLFDPTAGVETYTKHIVGERLDRLVDGGIVDPTEARILTNARGRFTSDPPRSGSSMKVGAGVEVCYPGEAHYSRGKIVRMHPNNGTYDIARVHPDGTNGEEVNGVDRALIRPPEWTTRDGGDTYERWNENYIWKRVPLQERRALGVSQEELDEPYWYFMKNPRQDGTAEFAKGSPEKFIFKHGDAGKFRAGLEVERAVEVSLEVAKRNHTLAVPQFYYRPKKLNPDDPSSPTVYKGDLQLLLPLERLHDGQVVAALAVATNPTDPVSYYASTVLSLSMALGNARLLTTTREPWIGEGARDARAAGL